MRFNMFKGDDLWRDLRRRILHETSSYLTDAMEHPDRTVSIPIYVVGKGQFTRSFSDEFWRQALSE